jgi:hypothetical protein
MQPKHFAPLRLVELLAAKQEPNVLFYMPNRTKCVLLFLVMKSTPSRLAQLLLDRKMCKSGSRIHSDTTVRVGRPPEFSW